MGVPEGGGVRPKETLRTERRVAVCSGVVELSKDRLKTVTQAEKQLEVATTETQLIGNDVDIVAIFRETGAFVLYIGRVLKMFAKKTGRPRSLRRIFHGVDPYNMPTGAGTASCPTATSSTSTNWTPPRTTTAPTSSPSSTSPTTKTATSIGYPERRS